MQSLENSKRNRAGEMKESFEGDVTGDRDACVPTDELLHDLAQSRQSSVVLETCSRLSPF